MIKKLRLLYDRRYKDFVVHYPKGKLGKGLLFTTIFSKKATPDFQKYPLAIKYEQSFLEELEELGFDPETIRFEISLKTPASPEDEAVSEKIKSFSKEPHEHLKNFSEEEMLHILEALETLKKSGFRELQNKFSNIWDKSQESEG